MNKTEPLVNYCVNKSKYTYIEKIDHNLLNKYLIEINWNDFYETYNCHDACDILICKFKNAIQNSTKEKIG